MFSLLPLLSVLRFCFDYVLFLVHCLLYFPIKIMNNHVHYSESLKLEAKQTFEMQSSVDFMPCKEMLTQFCAINNV